MTWILVVTVAGVLQSNAALNKTTYETQAECMRVVQDAIRADVKARTSLDQPSFRATCAPLAK